MHHRVTGMSVSKNNRCPPLGALTSGAISAGNVSASIVVLSEATEVTKASTTRGSYIRPPTLHENFDSLCIRHRRAIGTIGSQRVVAINN